MMLILESYNVKHSSLTLFKYTNREFYNNNFITRWLGDDMGHSRSECQGTQDTQGEY